MGMFDIDTNRIEEERKANDKRKSELFQKEDLINRKKHIIRGMAKEYFSGYIDFCKEQGLKSTTFILHQNRMNRKGEPRIGEILKTTVTYETPYKLYLGTDMTVFPEIICLESSVSPIDELYDCFVNSYCTDINVYYNFYNNGEQKLAQKDGYLRFHIDFKDIYNQNPFTKELDFDELEKNIKNLGSEWDFSIRSSTETYEYVETMVQKDLENFIIDKIKNPPTKLKIVYKTDKIIIDEDRY